MTNYNVKGETAAAKLQRWQELFRHLYQAVPEPKVFWFPSKEAREKARLSVYQFMAFSQKKPFKLVRVDSNGLLLQPIFDIPEEAALSTRESIPKFDTPPQEEEQIELSEEEGRLFALLEEEIEL